jgi:hypothetical protein
MACLEENSHVIAARQGVQTACLLVETKGASRIAGYAVPEFVQSPGRDTGFRSLWALTFAILNVLAARRTRRCDHRWFGRLGDGRSACGLSARAEPRCDEQQGCSGAPARHLPCLRQFQRSRCHGIPKPKLKRRHDAMSAGEKSPGSRDAPSNLPASDRG